jgi:hypothetical protein
LPPILVIGCLLAREIKKLKNTFQVNHSVVCQMNMTKYQLYILVIYLPVPVTPALTTDVARTQLR